MTFTTLGYAIIGGFLPAIIWLYFLLQEDAKHPEPKRLILFTFLAGAAAVALAIWPEKYVEAVLGPIPSPLTITAWALIEELLKYGMVAIFILWRPAVDEAPDYVIYLITAALGFAAAENVLFLMTPVSTGSIASSVFTGDIRFIGSTLLHVFASATIGFSLAFSSTAAPVVRMATASTGLILAVALHTAFNELIINPGTSTTLSAVFLVWIAAVVFFATFEVLKFFQYRTSSLTTYPS